MKIQMKKWLALLLTACLLCGALLPLCAAQAETGVISLRLNSDVAGCTREDRDRLIEIRSDNVVLATERGWEISIANAAGGAEGAHMDAGRTYTVTYTLVAAEGYTLPETLSEGDVLLETGKGVTVLNCGIIRMASVTGGEPARALRINADVKVDGTVIQRLIGFLRDLFLKLRSWQLY